MTEKHFETILAVLAEKIDEQAQNVSYLNWEVDNLKKELEECERSESRNEAL